MDECLSFDLAGDIVLEAILEMERLFLGHPVDQQRLVADPADLDAAEQVGFGARHLEHAARIELCLGAENLRIVLETDFGASPVGDLAELLEPALRLAALEHLSVELT